MVRYRILEVGTGDGRLVYWVQSKRYWFTPWITEGSPKESSSKVLALRRVKEMKRVEESNRKYSITKKRKVVSREEV